MTTVKKKFKQFITDDQGNQYFPLNHQYEGFPVITGCPEITWKEYIIIIYKNKILKKSILDIIKTPYECCLRYLVNYPIRKWGAFQFALVGTYRFGKSNFMHLMTAFLLARKHRILMFDDNCAEFRTLAAHGYFDKNKKFHSFKIEVFIPEGYTFDESAPNHNPIWKYRTNVILKTFIDPEEIIENLRPHVLTVVYTDAFEPASLLRLFITLMKILSRYTSISESYIFEMHEFSDLLPEGASNKTTIEVENVKLKSEIYNLIDEVVKITKRFARNRIGLLMGYHDSSDVTYKINRKFGVIGQKRSVRKKSMNQLEWHARNFSRPQIAISQGGYYRDHYIGKFPEVKDQYRIAPNHLPWYFDDSHGPIPLTKLLSELEEREELKQLEKEKSKEEKNELSKEREKEKITNRLYIKENELQFKKELEEFKTQQKLLLLDKQKEINDNKIIRKTCAYCGKSFYGKKTTLYCNPQHRLKAFRQRKNAEIENETDKE